MTELFYLTAVELAGMLRAREVSAREVVDAHLERIDRTNGKVNAIVTLCAERAMAEAAAADEDLAHGVDAGPLHGLPIAVKDTHATAGIRTTQGSPLFADFVPDADELLVERERAAGAIVVGKSNVPEFAAGSHTVNPVFGATRNPYDTTRSAGGSSGGGAVALACGMVPLADGSDMGGSLRNPGSFCNVVGFRPSPGRVPTWPSVTPWATLGVQGPLGRTVADAALLLSVQAGPDPRSPIAIDQPGSDFRPPLESDVSGLRLAWSPDLGGTVPVEPAVTEALAGRLGAFADLGCTVEQACPDFTGAETVFRTLRAWQFELALGALRDRHPDRIKSSLVWNVDVGRELRGTDIARAEQSHAELFHRMRLFFGDYDALLLPVSQVPPFDVELEYPAAVAGVPSETYLDWMRSAYFVSATGSPAISVPAGFTPDGLPVGLQIVGPHRDDLGVLRLAHAFEQATRTGERRPDFG
ncbi:MAG TPA: amidase [Pseudonocardiaceae bacterium]|nr:amidase [Pseudonocardiaceae bacterium]